MEDKFLRPDGPENIEKVRVKLVAAFSLAIGKDAEENGDYFVDNGAFVCFDGEIDLTKLADAAIEIWREGEGHQ